VTRKVGRPAQITLDAIIAAATVGNAKPTLKGIADVLGVTPQALYRHVSNYSDVQRIIFESLQKDIAYPTYRDQSWQEWLIEVAHYLRRSYEAIPRVFEIAPALPEIAARYEDTLRIAKTLGYNETDGLLALVAVVEFVQAWVGRERRAQSLKLKKREVRPLGFSTVLAADPKRFPLLKRAIKGVNKFLDQRFEYTARALIAGLTLEMKEEAGPRNSALRTRQKSR